MNKKENQNFIEEIEKNSKIFAEKINKLNSGYDSENSFEKKKQKNINSPKKIIYIKTNILILKLMMNMNLFKLRKKNTRIRKINK